MALDEIEEAFRAGYHCQWVRPVKNEQGHWTGGIYIFDPLLKPGDPGGAYLAWLFHRDLEDLTSEP